MNHWRVVFMKKNHASSHISHDLLLLLDRKRDRLVFVKKAEQSTSLAVLCNQD